MKCPFQKEITRRKYKEWSERDENGKLYKKVQPEAEFHYFAECLRDECPYYEKYSKGGDGCSRILRRFGE